jgi:anti-sigma B factor antagonist
VARNELEINASRDGEVDVVLIDGPVDSATIDTFKEQIDPICNRPGAKVILNCQHLSYLNSRAIGLLVSYHRRLISSRGMLTLCNLNPKLVRTLELLQLGKALLIFESLEKAREQL